MNHLCADIGYKSINHAGEQLCGDHVDIVDQGENSTVIVLADGLGSGVKASILSTLTSKIISTMMAEGLTLEDTIEDPVPAIDEGYIDLKNFLASLSEIDQNIVKLRIQGLTQKQITQELSMTQAKCAMRISKIWVKFVERRNEDEEVVYLFSYSRACSLLYGLQGH